MSVSGKSTVTIRDKGEDFLLSAYGRRVTRHRRRIEISQSALAAEIGCSVDTIKDIESGRTNFGVLRHKQICEVFGVSFFQETAHLFGFSCTALPVEAAENVNASDVIQSACATAAELAARTNIDGTISHSEAVNIIEALHKNTHMNTRLEIWLRQRFPGAVQ